MADLEHIAPIIKRTQKKFRLTPPKQYVPLEIDEQIILFEYAAIAERQDPRWHWLFATLNGVPLPIGLAKKMKRAGMKKGPLDIWLPVPSQGCVGLVGDLKRVKGSYGLRDEQEEWLVYLDTVGWKTRVWKGAKACIEDITEYLA